jgi:predicted  nucleic acid-binding Zn-ribbon protein
VISAEEIAAKVAACEPLLSREKYKQGISLWPCKRCGGVTEHKKVKGCEVCLECGFKMGHPHKDELTAKQRAYREAHKDELTAKQRAYYEAHKDELRARQREANRRYQQRKREKLQKLLANSQMEAVA